MTHVQKFWTIETEKLSPTVPAALEQIKCWLKENPSLPDFITEEQIALFLHACLGEVEDTKKCIENYYRLRKESPNFFQARDVHAENLRKALKVLYYGIFPEKTPDGCKVVFHMLNDTKPSNYVFNDGFKLLMMMIDAVNAKEGPQDGLIMLFDMRGVKLGHLIRLPIYSVRKSLEFIQDAIPIRLKSIHVLNVHSLIDKIMLLVKPFLKAKILDMLHFHKENDPEIYESIPKNCLPKNYGGELESVEYYHEKFIEEMESTRELFLEETYLFNKVTKS